MFNRLLKDCKTDKEKRELKELVQVSAPLFKRIFKVLDEELAELDAVSWEDFKNPSWALERAAKDGYKKGLTQLKKYVIM